MNPIFPSDILRIHSLCHEKNDILINIYIRDRQSIKFRKFTSEIQKKISNNKNVTKYNTIIGKILNRSTLQDKVAKI